MKKFTQGIRKHRENADRGLAQEDRRRPRFSRELSVLYEDDAVVVLDKPAGLLAVPVKGSDAPSALSLLVAKLEPQRQRALIVHRIDRFASGALLFADIAHIAGLVAAGIHPSPVGHADYAHAVGGSAGVNANLVVNEVGRSAVTVLEAAGWMRPTN